MTETRQMLDKARSLCTPPTWYQLALRLNVSHGSVSRWTNGDGFPDVKACFELARLVGRDAPTVIAVVEFDRARDEETKAYWSRLLPRVLPAAIMGIVVGLIGVRPVNIHGWQDRQPFDALYIMRTGRPGRRKEGFAWVRSIIRAVRARARSARPWALRSLRATSRRLAFEKFPPSRPELAL